MSTRIEQRERARQIRLETEKRLSTPPAREDLSVHEIERSGREITVRISVPGYDPSRPERDVGAGWFMGNPRGILVRVTELEDLRSIARCLNEAADQLEAEPIT